MSRNNLILVVRDRRRWPERMYVFRDVNADTEWNTKFARRQIDSGLYRYTRDRSLALVIAHNMQREINSEYGVRELFLKVGNKS
jgi:hypothetical protein